MNFFGILFLIGDKSTLTIRFNQCNQQNEVMQYRGKSQLITVTDSSVAISYYPLAVKERSRETITASGTKGTIRR